MTATAAASSSTATAHAIAFVAAHRARAEATGQALADDLLDPDALAQSLRTALASLAGEDDWGVTARMALEFRRPVPLAEPIRAEGWITEARRRIVRTEAVLTDLRDDTLLARATGTYVAADAERKAQLRERYAWQRLEAAT